MFDRVLIANRGEVAIRIARTLRRLGCEPATVYVREDAAGMHVRAGERSVEIGSYLDVAEIIGAAAQAGAQAVHPGYGFLSERAELARACEAAGLVWVGPPAEAIELMGDKSAAKDAAAAAGVPIVPGLHRAGLADPDIVEFARDAGFPLLVKAAAGGGGKGMRVVGSLDALEQALIGARREALAAFGDGALLVERYVSPARHIEIQVLADTHGTVIDLGERECSLQRRHQKVIEESPSPVVGDALRATLGGEATALARACGYVGAGTVEFIAEADAPDRHYFLEMNTRLQVEHAVTEAVRGLDLVEWQLRVAAGEPLAIDPAPPRGHAVEARIYAEDPRRGFLPASGRLLSFRIPGGEGVRVDAGVTVGDVVTTRFDPMVAKVTVHAPTRPQALSRLRSVLADTVLLGLHSNVGFLCDLLEDPDVRAGRVDTGFVEAMARSDVDATAARAALVALIAETDRHASARQADPFVRLDGWRIGEAAALVRRRAQVDGTLGVDLTLGPLALRPTTATVDGESLAVTLISSMQDGGHTRLLVAIDGITREWSAVADGSTWWVGCGGHVWAVGARERARDAEASASGELRAPMPGSIVAVNATEGASVVRGDVVLVVESMKMELQIIAPLDGTVSALRVAVGDQVTLGTVLATVVSDSPAAEEPG